MPELARALRDGGQIFDVMPEINRYYMDYYPSSYIFFIIEDSTTTNARKKNAFCFICYLYFLFSFLTQEFETTLQ